MKTKILGALVIAMMLVVIVVPTIAQTGIVELPFEVNRCGLPVVSVMIAEKTLHLIVDTGATVTTLDNKFLPAEGIRVRLFLTATRAFNMPVDFRSFSDGRTVCGKLDGLLGNDVLARTKSIAIDYKNKLITLSYDE